jgi:uncharacterized membrane protein
MSARERQCADAGSHLAELAQKRLTKRRKPSRDDPATTPRMPHAIAAQLSTRVPINSAVAANSRATPTRARPNKTFRTRATSTPTNHKRATHACDSRSRARTASGITHDDSTARSTEEPYMSEQASLLAHPNTDVNEHPMVRDVNEEHEKNLSATERYCKKIADATGAPVALALAIVSQIAWVVVGSMTHWDPFPFVFLLTMSNILQLILIFVIAVAQKQGGEHAELRAEADHESIARLLHHQEVQEELLLRLAQSTQCDVTDIRVAVQSLMEKAA